MTHRVASMVLVCPLVSVLFAQTPDKVAYGKYLVEEVGKCQECHTPKMENGQLDKTKWMKGAELDFQPMKPIERCHKTSPDLTPGSRLWQRWKEEGIRKFMETGLNPLNGRPADPPMPTYKLKPQDAEAVIEYPKSLK